MYKKLVILIVFCLILNSIAFRSSLWSDVKANGLSSVNQSIPNGTYVLKSMHICKINKQQEQECAFDKFDVKGTAKISLSKILEGQYWLVLRGYSKLRFRDSYIAFGCKSGMIDSHIFFDNISKLDGIQTQDKAISAVSSQVRIFENSCSSETNDFLCDGNFLGSYFYFYKTGKLLIHQTRVINGKRVKMYSEFIKS